MCDSSPAPAPAAPTSQQVTQSNIPEWAIKYASENLGKAQALTDTAQNPYQQYQGQRIADFNPMQQQAFSGIAGMQPSAQTGQATGLAGMSGLGGLAAGQNYFQQASDPAAMAKLMSSYQQNVTDFQKQQAIQDYSRQLPGMGAAAANAGAFGGSRQAIAQSEAQRNLTTGWRTTASPNPTRVVTELPRLLESAELPIQTTWVHVRYYSGNPIDCFRCFHVPSSSINV